MESSQMPAFEIVVYKDFFFIFSFFTCVSFVCMFMYLVLVCWCTCTGGSKVDVWNLCPLLFHLIH